MFPKILFQHLMPTETKKGSTQIMPSMALLHLKLRQLLPSSLELLEYLYKNKA